MRLSDSAAIEMRPTSSVCRNWLSPIAGSPTRCSSATHTSSNHSSRVSRPFQPMPRIFGPIVNPAVSFSTTKLAYVCRESSSSRDSVRASSVTPNDMSVPAFEMNVLRPLISQPPSWRTARVWMPRASEPASGSVSPKAPSTRPSANGRSHRSRCSSFPKSSSGSDPMVTCACHAAATDWSARPICSIAATKPTVDIPMPPHSSGTSTPSRPSAPISRSRSVGQTASSHAWGARGRDLLLRELPAQTGQVPFGLGEREVHRRDVIGPDGTNRWLLQSTDRRLPLASP